MTPAAYPPRMAASKKTAKTVPTKEPAKRASAAKKAPAIEEAAPAKQPSAKKAAPAKPAAAKPPAKKAMPTRRADLGAPADGYFARQPPDKRALLDPLRALVRAAAPTAHESIKWGMPFYTLGGSLCALSTFKAHVSINFFAPPDVLTDPDGRLEGTGKGMRHLKVRAPGDIDRARVRRWLAQAVAHAKKGA